MLKDVTLGQFFPGNSPVHRMDPRTKLILLVAYIVALFSAENWISYGIVFLFLAFTIAISTIPLKSIVSGMKPLVMILIFTGVLNIFFTTGEDVLLKFWVITIYWEGIIRALFMMARILMLITGTFLLTYTTSPIALTDGLESLLSPLKKLRLPVHELSMMMCIALRFIPTLIEETDKIMSAQKARGADFESGKLMQRVKALVPILVPLFISAFRRADELATAMECRCYRGDKNRTKMVKLSFKLIDLIWFLIFALFIGTIIALKILPTEFVFDSNILKMMFYHI